MKYHDNQTILLVEDELPWQTMLAELCKTAGFSVVQVFDVHAALHQLQNVYPPPVLAIVDLKLQDSAPQQDYEGLRFLNDLCDRGVYMIIVSGYIYRVRDSLIGRPEIHQLVDKAHFTADENFGNQVFIPWVRDAVAHAVAALQAEGQLPEQQERLRLLSR